MSVARIERMLAEHPTRFRERCFTERELAYASSRPELEAQHLAARFAAKEAIFKALRTAHQRGVRWLDLEVTRQGDGAPGVALHGQAREIATERGITAWAISLTHTGELATASVIAMGAGQGAG